MKNKSAHLGYVKSSAFNSFFCLVFLFVFVFGHSLYYIAFILSFFYVSISPVTILFSLFEMKGFKRRMFSTCINIYYDI